MMDQLDQALFCILVDHDVAISTRNQQRTELMWPDLSDIHIETRRKIRELFAGCGYNVGVALQLIEDH